MSQKRLTHIRSWMFLAGLVLICTLVACEHAKFWRGSHPDDIDFRWRMSDPEAAEAELQRRMAPPAPKTVPARLGSDEKYEKAEWIDLRSFGCISCHGQIDEPDMHIGRKLAIGCVDCHGGDPTILSTLPEPGRPGTPGTAIADEAYLEAMRRAHVLPENPEAWYGRHQLSDGRSFGEHHQEDPTRLHGSRNPQISYALLNHESPEFIRFINPGDLRVAAYSCGACHQKQVANVRHSMMNHGSMLWGAALYNNGSIPNKIPRFGESYSAFGLPQRLQGVIDEVKWDKLTNQLAVNARWPTKEEIEKRGALLYLDPLPVWNVSQPGNILRIFERGTKLPVPGGATPNPNPAEIANPNPFSRRRPARQGPFPTRTGNPQPHRSGIHRPAEDPIARSQPVDARHQ